MNRPLSTIGISPEAQMFLNADHNTLVGQYGDSSHGFATAADPDALQVLLPVYNIGEVDTHTVSHTLASLSLAAAVAADNGISVRPLVIVNGPEEGPVPEIAIAFGLSRSDHLIQLPADVRGKTRALKAGFCRLREEGFSGTIMTTDDDAILPSTLPTAVMEHMKGAQEATASGGTIRYYATPGVRHDVVAARNFANAVLEVRAARKGNVRAHGNNAYFHADARGRFYQVVTKVMVEGYGDDKALANSIIQSADGEKRPMLLETAARVAVAGDRSKSWKDLYLTAIGRGDRRYRTSPGWAEFSAGSP